MERTLIYAMQTDPVFTAGITVGDFLRSRGYSRHLLSELKKQADGVWKNQAPCRMYETLEPFDTLEIHLYEEGDITKAPPSQVPLQVVYEDEDILVIDKPAGMPVHPSAGHRDDTLANALNGRYGAGKDSVVFRCINRLDRDTSGLLILAKHMLSGCMLSQDMKQRKIRRTYLALVFGCIDQAGTIDAPIARVEGSVIKRCIQEGGERAVTHYIPIQYLKEADMTLLRIQLETGRTHQIRVHLSSIGHPLAGDSMYSEGYKPVVPVPFELSRQALHSAELMFRHPISGELLTFTSPLPNDICVPGLSVF